MLFHYITVILLSQQKLLGQSTIFAICSARYEFSTKEKKANMARSNTQSKFVRKNMMDNVREHSNGESAFLYFADKIKENSLYLLDEPENSLSPEKQQELLKFLEDSARFFGCQFVIATHSPFLLSMKGAKIYDMDEEVVDIKRWSELKNVRAYFDFFKKHEKEFFGSI